MLHNSFLISTIALSTLLATSGAATAKQVCGWYAIAYCSTNEAAVWKFTDKGWGATINTNNFRGFAPGKFCAVSGPQSKASAIQDRRNAIGSGVSDDVYIKRACADDIYVGD